MPCAAMARTIVFLLLVSVAVGHQLRSFAPAGAPGGAPAGAPGAPGAPELSPAEHLARAEKGLESEGAPEHGFDGNMVQHDDKKTMTEDFGNEYGPNGPKSVAQVCAQNPNSYWCKQHAAAIATGGGGAYKPF